MSVRLFSLGLFIAIWAIASFLGGDEQSLPSPLTVAGLIVQETASGTMVKHLAATLSRVIAAFTVSMAIGLTLGLIMGRNRLADRWFDPWLVIFLNLPALVAIVLCYIWIGLTEAAAVIAVAVNKIPLVTAMIREGARAFDPALDDLAAIYRLGRRRKLFHLVLPQLAPHLAAAARSGLALIWKIVLVVEFLGRPNGVGFQIHLYFQLFDVGMILAYAFAFIAVMLAIEIFVLQPAETRVNRWRRS